MKTRFCSVVIALCLALPGGTRRRAESSPKGLASEQSLPSRYEYVVQDMLKYCQPQKGFWVDLGAGQGQVAWR